MSVLLFLSFFVILIMVAMSLRPTVLIYADFWALPFPPTYMNYRAAVFDLIPAMLRTLGMTFASIVGILFLACPAAYAVARTRSSDVTCIYYMILGVLMIPGAILLDATFHPGESVWFTW